ncbi:ATP-binding protein [uncultured Croceitalea sp.]|uniref:sensor histidine kinase n=1 Tax=uncultured Croceitalea sp. TaxID=1798908 RepID=UPI00374F4AAB
MHKLLLRQLRKHLPDSIQDRENLEPLLDAISRSYEDNDSKLELVQRSTLISSNELSEANENLVKTAEAQKEIIASLERSIKTLSSFTTTIRNYDSEENKSFDPLLLAKKLEEQSTKINRISTEKDTLLKDLEERNEALNDYAHMVSHDLKSPMRNINFLIGCIKEEDIDNFSDNSKANYMLISENLEKMEALVNGILQHATITNADDKKVPVNIEQLVSGILKTIYVPDTICVRVKKPMPKLVLGKYKLEQLFKNLLLNAITAIGEKKNGLIKIEAKEQEEDYQFSITDNGKGIEKKYQEDIFSMFKKLENDFKSTGIGLALVKKIVNAFEGEIWLESELGYGTTFYFTIKKELL